MSSLILWGAVATLIGALASIFAPNLKQKAEKLAASRSEEKKQLAPRTRKYFVALTVLGALGAVAGSVVLFFAGAESGDAQARHAEKLLKQATDENKRASLEVSEKLHAITAMLGKARQSETENLTDAKLAMIEEDVAKWAEHFQTTRLTRLKEIDRARLASLETETKVTEQSRPVFLFIVRCLEELLKAYSKQSGEVLTLENPALPANFFHDDLAGMKRQIRFQDKTSWIINVGGVVPAKEGNPPWLKIWVMKKEAGVANAWFRFRVDSLRGRISVDLEGPLPDPSPNEGYLEIPITGYENTIRSMLARHLEAQILSSKSN